MKAALRELAVESGFAECRVARADTAPHAEAFLRWLNSGSHGEMAWLARNPARRTDPKEVLGGAKSVIVLAANYFQGDQPITGHGRVARYAWGEDYHAILKESLEPIEKFLAAQGGEQKSYVDTGPVLERDYAALSGLAWQAKSTMSLHPKLGTWFFLAVILTTLELAPDLPAKNRCGSCQRCIDACPTRAITAPYQLDARKCLSYLTIENKGAIPVEYRRMLGARIYGCDDCLEVCPWNRFAQKTRETRFNLLAVLRERTLAELAQLTAEEFRQVFQRSPIKRLTYRRLLRNVCVALGNVGSNEDTPVLRELANHEDALIAEHALWALEEIQRRTCAGKLNTE
jgi:epoxyqueuosine reductase